MGQYIYVEISTKVRMPPSNQFDRLAVELNEDLLTDLILCLGTRVGVETLEVHVKALYSLMMLPVSSLFLEHMAYDILSFLRYISRDSEID